MILELALGRQFVGEIFQITVQQCVGYGRGGPPDRAQELLPHLIFLSQGYGAGDSISQTGQGCLSLRPK